MLLKARPDLEPRDLKFDIKRVEEGMFGWRPKQDQDDMDLQDWLDNIGRA